MPLPLGRFGQWGGAAVEHGKRLIHTVVFSMPSNATHQPGPTVTSSVGNASASVALPKAQGQQAVSFGSYAGSGYDVTLIITAILLNRIHNIVARERRPQPPPPGLPGWRAALRRRVREALTSPAAPAWLRVPGILALVRAWMLFTVVLMQTANMWPLNAGRQLEALKVKSGVADELWAYPLVSTLNYLGGVVDRLGAWGASMQMADVCWTVFLSVCFGLTMGALSTGLDVARRRDVGVGFNLFGFSFILHIYASPLTHVRNAPHVSPHSRPDVHALLQLWIGLTELTWLQANELSPTLRRNQLLPTGVCGVVGLTAFLHSLWSSQLRFPSFTFLTHLLASVLSVIIGCTIAVRAVTLVFTHGYIPSPILSSLLPHEGALPSKEDDFGVALLKLGVACLESTQFSGLRNELASVEEAQPHVRLNVDGVDMIGTKKARVAGFGARIDKIEAVELRDPNAESPYVVQACRFWGAVVGLTHNMFWSMLLSTWVGRDLYRLSWRLYQGRWWYGPRHWAFWRRAAWDGPPAPLLPREPPLLVAWAIAKARRRALEQLGARRLTHRQPQPQATAEEHPEWTYDQVLRGEVDVEDDDDDWRSEGTSASVETMADVADEDDDAALYRDLVKPPTPSEDGESIQPILLAHLTSSSSSPLTRRRYAQIMSGPPSGPSTPTRAVTSATNLNRTPLEEAIAVRQSETVNMHVDQWDEDRRHACVICMVATRDVILWPCRCLLMCGDCRESLAARLAPKDHACPNCRTKVEGYSRIYVP